MNISEKIETLKWYLSNKSYRQQALRLLRSKTINKGKEKTKTEAVKWCNEQAISTQEAVYKLTGSKHSDIFMLHEEVFLKAEKHKKQIPVKMGGPGDLNLVYHLAEVLSAEKVIETGVAYGWTSLALLLSLKNRSQGKLISTDMPYAKMNNEAYVGGVVPENLKSQWEIIREPDITGLPEALRKFNYEIDMCHYDSDKSYTGRMWAYPLLWKAIKSGGFFISDDIGDNIAFQEFSSKIDADKIIIKYKNQFVGLIQKP